MKEEDRERERVVVGIRHGMPREWRSRKEVDKWKEPKTMDRSDEKCRSRVVCTEYRLLYCT